MKALLLIISLTLALLISSCAQNGMKSTEARLLDDGFRRLNAAEITDALAGNTYTAKVAGITYHLYFISDGTCKGKQISSSGQIKLLSGTWKVSEKENVFCDQWDTFGSGSDCDLIYMKGDEIVLTEHSGRESSRGRIEQGNSREL